MVTGLKNAVVDEVVRIAEGTNRFVCWVVWLFLLWSLVFLDNRGGGGGLTLRKCGF